MTERLNVRIRVDANGVSVVALAGTLDAHTTRILENVHRGLRESRVDTLVLDLESLAFADAEGLRNLREFVAQERAVATVEIRQPPAAV
jgi:anti-anti-sigma regulatory factor